MDVILDELHKYNIDIDKTTLTYYMNDVYERNKNLYDDYISKIFCSDLFTIWRILRASTFGHVLSYLVLVDVVYLAGFLD